MTAPEPRNVVQLSAIGADAESPANYARSKAAGEAAVLAHIPGAVILRPSIVFGPEDQFFNRFARMAQFLPFLPLIGAARSIHLFGLETSPHAHIQPNGL